MNRLIFASLGLFVSAAGTHDHSLCQGFFPENDLEIPVPEVGSTVEGGLTEAQFNGVLDRVENIYKDADKLVIARKWRSRKVNAYANRSGDTQVVTMFGGLARHKTITEDGFLVVVCHELGHHFGGAPRYPTGRGRVSMQWASVEGQSDYYATLKCLHRMWENEDNQSFLEGKSIDPFAETECRRQFTDEKQLNICRRSTLAAQSLANLFAVLGRDKTRPDFMTPDPKVVEETYSSHPKAQCRLDTLFQGALCTVNANEPLSSADPNVGACSKQTGHERGLRPLCWFKEPI